MHEAGIAEQTLKIAERAARENGIARVTRLVMEIGQLCGVEPEALRFAFEALRDGTILEKAEMEILTPPLLLSCSLCENEYAAGLDDLRCPVCRGGSCEILQGHELCLKTIVGERDEDER